MKLLVTDTVRSALDGASKVRSGSFIFCGDSHIGKATAARELARSLNCLGDSKGPCVNCRRLEAGAYPDFITVAPETGSSILISQFRSLRSAVSLRPYQAGRRVVLIDGADLLTDEAQNALLKLIEEPPEDTLFILATTKLTALLPTVRSRCALVYFSKVPQPELADYLLHEYQIPGPKAQALAAAASGVPGRAILGTRDEASDSATITSALDRSLLERLASVKKYLDSGADPQSLVDALHDDVTRGLIENGEAKSSTRLIAIEQLASYLDAGVSPRIALERLMVEL